LFHIDPDIAYFENSGNSLTREQQVLLQDLAYICDFKATSDLPQWMTKEEHDALRVFLDTKPKVTQASRYVFHIDDRIADFTSAIELPKAPKGLTALFGRIVGWLGGRYSILRMYKILDLGRFRKRRSS
jgi:hypothetical protein